MSAEPQSQSEAPTYGAPSNDSLTANGLPSWVGAQPKPFQVYTYIPKNAALYQPLQVVVALHGMSGNGRGFAAALVNDAEQHHWVVIAPTIDYGDWGSPELVASEELENTQRLLSTVSLVERQSGLRFKSRIHLYGFSRGAQFAHRFALFFPEHVDRVVAYSAGTYTLPYRQIKDLNGEGRPDLVVLPYGVGDLGKRLGRPINPARLRQVNFMIGVGGADNSANDVPHQWDPYLGKTRLERAREFASALEKTGVNCKLQVFPGVGHEVTASMLSAAVQFLANGELPSTRQAAY